MALFGSLKASGLFSKISNTMLKQDNSFLLRVNMNLRVVIVMGNNNQHSHYKISKLNVTMIGI